MITGGGTGGHTSPACAIIEELQKRDPQLILQWVGRAHGIEERICRARAYPFRSIWVEGWPRGRSLRKAWAAIKLGVSMLQCMLFLRKFKPQAVIGVGGYVSLPLMYMAQRAGIPTFLHEQNRLLGMSNRICAPRATRIFLSYSDTKGDFPVERAILAGNPVRPGFIHPPSREEALAAFGLESHAPVVLVVGGSQGAQHLNEALASALPLFKEGEAQFIWMTGVSGANAAREAAAQAAISVHVFPFIDDMPAACAAADLILSRSGASSTAEIAVMRKPSILVPYPHATDNHQEQNARAFEAHGASQVLLDAECTPERLASLVRGLLAEPERLSAMGRAAGALAKPAAAERIADEILALAFH